MAATKLIKVNGGSAFIEIGESYIRIGVGDRVFITLDENTITNGADKVNWQMSPDRVSYMGILKNAGPVQGMLPVGPTYKLDLDIVRSIVSTAAAMALIKGATIGVG